MSNSKNLPDAKYFCIQPFIGLSPRPNGLVTPCSNVVNCPSIPKKDAQLKPDQEKFILQKDSIKDVWNSEFIKQFRRDKFNNVSRKECESCAFDDQRGFESKRQTVNKVFFEKYKERVFLAMENDGQLDLPPVHWEMRLSNICNYACRMCTPKQSSKLQTFYEKNYQEILPELKDLADGFNKLAKSDGLIGKSTFYMDQLFESTSNMESIEFHGGEPTLEVELWDLLKKLELEKQLGKVFLRMHTNASGFKAEQIELLNGVQKGHLNLSIDAVGEENEYQRYLSNWDNIETQIKKLKALDTEKWSINILASMSAYTICSVDRLILWANDYFKSLKLPIELSIGPVHFPEWLQSGLVPVELRKQCLDRIDSMMSRLDYIWPDGFEESEYQSLKSMLSEETKNDPKLISKFKHMTDVYNNTSPKKASEVFRPIEQFLKDLDL